MGGNGRRLSEIAGVTYRSPTNVIGAQMLTKAVPHGRTQYGRKGGEIEWEKCFYFARRCWEIENAAR
ncbi:hypothetical protein L1049_008400 [Liquidambar formosana]|uniref:Uncharacterized protein n=1 Tax=Liquidambar formosana TaxID=63359 RepID=A0AAP0S6D3_LIQFO